MDIQWYPGHMAKTKRLLAEQLKSVDIVLELLDARIPYSSQNPELGTLAPHKPRVLILNKCDLADPADNQTWRNHFSSLNLTSFLVNTQLGKGFNEVKQHLKHLMSEKTALARAKGRLYVPVRCMVVGIPNVGKSSFINKMVGRHIANTGDRPGITRNNQWVRIAQEIDLLDTPGLLWPKFDDKEAALRLAITGAIKDTLLDPIEIANALLEILKEKSPLTLSNRYKLQFADIEEKTLLPQIAKKRGCIGPKGAMDLEKASSILLDDFRSGKLGFLTLDTPPEVT